ncbi:MAG: hypothetical protein U5S82_09105 [Gammaproteobacteria bacterium]|nr:hypothetical protein [Gammaproteobacteria bacterium]
MDRHDIDWSVLRGAIVILVITLAVASAMVVASRYFKAEQEQAFSTEQRRFLNASRKYLSVDEEERLIREYLPRFEALKAAGLIGEEQRLQWLETLRRVKEELRLPTLQYSISPRGEYEPPAKLPRSDYEPYASAMELTAGLVHETDLFRLFDRLERDASGSFSVDGCALSRRGRDTAPPQPDQPNLMASCRLLWITLRNPS